MDSSSGDDSGKVYDFKDSKTSGVVTVTKSWEDSMSNDERPVPDISISTAKPSKNPLGYTITYHGNGLTFAGGNSENEIVVNSSGKILSGQYKLPGNTAVTWYLDSQCTSKIETDNSGLPLSGIYSDLDLYAKPKTFLLKGYNSSEDYNEFFNLVPSTATSIVFTDEAMPTSAALIDADADGDGGVVAWMDGTTMKVSTQISGQKIIAPSNCTLMFFGLSKVLSINLSNLDTSNVTTMESMFYHCSGLTTLDLTPLNTSNVTNMSSMFYGCRNIINLNLSPLNTNNVTDMSEMFSGCSGFTTLDLTPLNTSKVTDMSDIFRGCSKLTNIDLTPLDTSLVTNMSGIFANCSKLTSINLSPLDTRNITDMSYMFSGCSGLTTLDLSPLNTQKVTSMNYMFSGCSGLTNLDLTPLDTSKVTNISGIFAGCSGLTNLDLTPLNTQNVTNMSYMFSGCSGLTALDLTPLDTKNVTSMKDMFSDCSEIIKIDISTFNTLKVSNMYEMLSGCKSLISLNLNVDTSNVTTMTDMFGYTTYDGEDKHCNKLTLLSVSDKFSFVGSNYNLPAGTWYASDGTAYTSNGKSCTIPNNKADTYTRR